MRNLVKILANFTNNTSLGQGLQWKAHHRKICKAFNRFTASPSYQSFSAGEAADALMLSQVISQLFPSDDYTLDHGSMDPASAVFFDLLPASSAPPPPPLCKTKASIFPNDIATTIFSRFGNNNFVLHSHLTPYAHGVFPLASRLFNHSCSPNCVARYVITPTYPVKMEVVSLTDIAIGEEVGEFAENESGSRIFIFSTF